MLLKSADMRKVLFLCATLLLSGCVATGPTYTHTGAESIASQGLLQSASWRAQGQMIFRCAYDEKGFFWQFIRPEGALYDKVGRRQAVLQPNFAITARDGSMLHARIIEQGQQESPRNLRTVTFETTSEGKGLLDGVRYVVRQQAVGGMPLVTCSAAQRGHLLKVPFRAQYIFYRQNIAAPRN